MEMVQVPLEMLNKTAGFVETVKGVLDKKAAAEAANRVGAKKVAKELAAGGFMPAEKVAGLVETLSTNPAKGFDIISRFAQEASASRTKLAAAEKKAAARDEGVPSIGAPDAGKSAAKPHTAKKASDDAWERGFQV